MKKLLCLLLWLINFSLNAQVFSGYYVKNNFDTINCSILVRKHRDFYDFSGVTRRVNLFGDEGRKTFRPHEIICFVINIPDEGTYKFVSLQGDRSDFYQVIINGKISLYKTYSRNPYDGSLAIIPVAIKDNKLVYLNVINRKQRVINLINDNPEVLEKWEAKVFNFWTDSIFDTTELEVLIREYNESE